MAAAARNVIRSKRSPGGRSKPTAATTRRKDALDGDPQLQPGMDHVGVLSHRVLVRFVELGPALGAAHLGLGDPRKGVSRLHRVGLRTRRILSSALAAALLHDPLGLGLLFCDRLVRRGSTFATWHVTPLSSMTPAYRRPQRSKAQRWVIALHALALDLVDPVRPINGLAIGPREAPGIAAVGPVRRLEPMRVSKVFDCRRRRAASVQGLTESEVRGRRCLVDRTGSAATDHLIRRKGISTLAAMLHPVSKRGYVSLGLDVKRSDQLDPLALDG